MKNIEIRKYYLHLFFFIKNSFTLQRLVFQENYDCMATDNLTTLIFKSWFERIFFQDLYVYVSEKTDFHEFNDSSALIWTKNDLWYGDYYSGENEDGTFTFSTQIPTTEVGHCFFFLSLIVFFFISQCKQLSEITCNVKITQCFRNVWWSIYLT